MPGNWKNQSELEDVLSLDELTDLLTKAREVKWDEMKFLAKAMNPQVEFGDDQPAKNKFDEIAERVHNRLNEEGTGMSTEELDLQETLGITFTKE